MASPYAGAVVSIVGTDVTTTTDADGKYALQVPRRCPR